MSVMDENPDEIFMRLMEDVELDIGDAVNYHELDDIALSNAYHEARSALFEMGQLHNLNPIGEAADLHSKFAAINHEMTRRWPNGAPDN